MSLMLSAPVGDVSPSTYPEGASVARRGLAELLSASLL